MLKLQMPASAQLASVLYALGAFLSWGISDFVGGYTARRFNSFYLAALGHLSGTTLMVCLALANHETLPALVHLRWAFAAGACGGVALALFYRALSGGNMGLAAPVSAVLGAAIPVAFSMLTEGLPKALPIAGFVIALAGIWLISRPEDGRRPEGLALALISGVGFALFYIFIKQAGKWCGAMDCGGLALGVAGGDRSDPLRRAKVVPDLSARLRDSAARGLRRRDRNLSLHSRQPDGSARHGGDSKFTVSRADRDLGPHVFGRALYPMEDSWHDCSARGRADDCGGIARANCESARVQCSGLHCSV